jgi:hypothetical protein
MNNEIIIRSVYGKVQQIYFIQPCPNPKTGKLPACVKTVNSNGDMILSEEEVLKMSRGLVHYVPADHVFQIVDGTKFDLNDVVDKANWEAIEHCSWIAKSRFERDSNGELIIDGNAIKYGIADLYVEHPGEITQTRVNRKQLIHNACDYIYNDSESERIKKCRVLGRNLSNAIPADIIDFLIEIAEKDPKKIINLYEGEDWKMHLFILDAVERGVIRKGEGIYTYDDKTLGASVEAVILLFRDVRYKKLVDSIKRETYPNLLPKNEILELQNELTNGIPHFDTKNEDITEELPSVPTKIKKK